MDVLIEVIVRGEIPHVSYIAVHHWWIMKLHTRRRERGELPRVPLSRSIGLVAFSTSEWLGMIRCSSLKSDLLFLLHRCPLV